MSSFGYPSALRFFPVTAVKKASGLEARAVDIVEAAGVDCDSVRLGTRHVERVHPAMRAECVLGHASAERVDRQGMLSPQQFEILRRGWQVKDALLGADGAAAL